MGKARKTTPDQKKKTEKKLVETQEKEQIEKKIDEELNQSFPASDPPSYSQPGNHDIKHY